MYRRHHQQLCCLGGGCSCLRSLILQGGELCLISAFNFAFANVRPNLRRNSIHFSRPFFLVWYNVRFKVRSTTNSNNKESFFQTSTLTEGPAAPSRGKTLYGSVRGGSLGSSRKSGMRRGVLLGAICAGPGLAASRSWTCSLSYSPVQNVELSGPQQELLREKDGGGGRHLRARALANYDAIGLPRGYVERHVRADTIYDGVNNTAAEDPAAVYQEGRICTCATGLASGDREYYCPTPTDHCSVWRPWHSATHRVTCYQETTWTVGFARNVWYYLCFALLVLAIYPCFAGPGRVRVSMFVH